MTRPINVALIYGSVREGRFCDKVANWAAAQIASRDTFAIDVIDPAIFGFGTMRVEAAAVRELRQRLDKADAFVIVTPEYNHGYPAALKLLIDAASREWQAKPVAFVSYGGISGGLRAVEQLRPVFAELHAVTIRDGVSFANVWEQFGFNGQAPATADKPMSIMLGRLNWWAHALRNARGESSYESIAA